ncbi:MAG: signal peptidase I [Chloroflexota bacterium]|nr:MAG: signal peptidase I [Chloroflexota bacterium]
MKILRDFIAPILVGLVVFALFQAAVGSFKVYGSSMLPTIEEGDYIMVSKASYFFGEPQRGDIIVLRSPQNPNSDLIKRVIAMPGDNVEIKDDTVFVNGAALVEPYTLEPPHYLVLPQEIPSGQYFVLGDNRNNSSDSHRGWTVPRENIVGKAWITYWPPYRWSTIEHYPLNAGVQAAITELSLAIKTLCQTR